MNIAMSLAARLLCACLLLAPMAQAGTPAGRYSFRSYGPDHGLRNQAVTALAQDRAGYLFVATEDGLYRFDGQAFQALDTDDGLPSASVNGLHASRTGVLWVVTQKGLVAWSGSGRDRRFPQVLLPEAEVLGIASADDGHLLVSTTTGTLAGVPPRLRPVPGLPATAGAAWLSADGQQALVARHGALYRKTADGRWQRRLLPGGRGGETPQAVVQDPGGRIWIRGRQMLLRLASFEAPVEDLTARLPGEAVQKGELVLDDSGHLWAPTNQGIAVFDVRPGTREDRPRLIDSAHGLPNEWATTVMRDREGSLWVGSEGVQQLLGRLQWSATTRQQGLPSDTVWGVFRDRAGTLWAATNRGVAYAEGDAWKVVPGTGTRSFYTFAESPAGDLWVGGNAGGDADNMLLRRRPGGAGFEAVPLASAKGASTVNSLGFGPDGALYVGTMAQGLHRLLPTTNGGVRSEAVALPQGTAGEQINQVARGAGGTVWVAGMRGLAVFDGARWRRLAAAEGLRETEVETVTPAGPGVAWVSYWNVEGLTRVVLAADGSVALHHVLAPAALVEDTIYSAGFDRHGMWLGTAGGVKRWRDGRVERFGRAQGLPGDDAAANGFWADRNGDVWFGMANGLARFEAREDAPTPAAPRTVVQSTVDGRGRVLAASVPRVAWDARALTFHFATLSFLDSAQLQREVRLLGFEDAWRPTTVNEARYTGLLPGSYRFQVRARRIGGVPGPIATRTVVILPPWWLTWWFLVLAVAVLVGMGLLGVRWRLARLRRHNAALETQVQARTRELVAANAALEEASMVDPLTGLKNRRYLSVFMPEELARVQRLRSPSRPATVGREHRNVDLCLLMVDLDHFKQVNDTHGHAAGDAMLRQVGEILRRTFRDSDVVVRWGGEEFLILARNADRNHCAALAEGICQAIRTHAFDLGNGTVLRKTCSVGFTALPPVVGDADTGWEAAVELADQCLYAAKHSGRDGWVGCLLREDVVLDHAQGLPPAAVLAAHGQATLQNSFGEDHPLRWK